MWLIYFLPQLSPTCLFLSRVRTSDKKTFISFYFVFRTTTSADTMWVTNMMITPEIIREKTRTNGKARQTLGAISLVCNMYDTKVSCRIWEKMNQGKKPEGGSPVIGGTTLLVTPQKPRETPMERITRCVRCPTLLKQSTFFKCAYALYFTIIW